MSFNYGAPNDYTYILPKKPTGAKAVGKQKK